MTVKGTTVLRGTILNATSSLIGMVVLFIEGVIVSRNLSVDDNGTFFLLLSVVSVWMIAADAGSKASATQRLAAAAENERGQLAADLIGTRLVVTVLVAGVLWVTRVPVATVFGLDFYEANLAAILVLLVVTSLDELIFSVLRGFQTHGALASLLVVRSLTRLSITAGLVLIAGWGLNALVLSWSIALGLGAVLGVFALPVRLRTPQLGLAHLSNELAIGRPHIATRALAVIRNHAANILLFQFLGFGAVAAYAFALRIPSGLQTLLESYNNVVYPRLSELRAQPGGEPAANDLLARSITAQTFLLSGVALAGSFVADELMELLWSTTYRDAGTIFVVLLAALVFQVTTATLGYALLSAGEARLNALLLLAGTAVYLTIASVLAASLADGRLGPAIAALAEGVLLFCVMIVFMRRIRYNVSLLASWAGPVLALVLGSIRLVAVDALDVDSLSSGGVALSLFALALYGSLGLVLIRKQFPSLSPASLAR